MTMRGIYGISEVEREWKNKAGNYRRDQAGNHQACSGNSEVPEIL